jgi:hypothetical protein
MAAAKRILGAVSLAGAAVFVGALAGFLPMAVVVLLGGALGFFVLIAVIRFGTSAGDGGAWHPVLMLLTCLSVLLVTWNGVPVASTSISDIILVLALAVLGICWIQGTIQLPLPGWLVGASFMLIAAQLIASLAVPVPPVDPPPSYTVPAPIFVTLAKVELGMLMVPILIGAVASSWKRLDLIINLWLISAAISAIVAVIDSVTGLGIGFSITKVQLAEAPREAGLSLHPNHLALASTLALPVALHRVAFGRGLRSLVGLGVSGILVAGILVSGSRVGLVAAVLAVLLTGLVVSRLRSRLVFAGLAALGAMVAVVSFVPSANSILVSLDRLAGGGTASLADDARTVQVGESLDIAFQNPVTGVGFQVIQDAHSVPVQFWEAGGILGIVAFLLYSLGVGWTAWKLFRNRRLPRGIPELAGVLAVSYTAWLIGGLYTSILGDRYLYMAVGLLLGIQLAARGIKAEQPLPPERETALLNGWGNPPSPAAAKQAVAEERGRVPVAG